MSNITKVFFDMEFTGMVPNTTPISLAMIADTGDEFYAEFIDYDSYLVDDWIKENVIANLLYSGDAYDLKEFDLGNGCKATHIIDTYDEITDRLCSWLEKYDNVQLIGDTCFYDMVLLCNMFDGSFSLPRNVSPVPYDISYDMCARHETEYGLGVLPDPDCMCGTLILSRENIYKRFIGKLPEGKQHNALYDARITKGLYERYHKTDILKGGNKDE